MPTPIDVSASAISDDTIMKNELRILFAAMFAAIMRARCVRWLRA